MEIKLRGFRSRLRSRPKTAVVLLFYKCTAILSKYRALAHGIRYFDRIRVAAEIFRRH
jgi:hypothetical protein